ncbi:MAG TPA: 4-hydroxy-3-methylbut-2-enyl diphosphate reductase [Bacteroidota bacterium]|nr:4-hydroxy-3-methylbut-2-enyl diphosphate reductase [Bacteroidota bacterium]
MLQEVILGKYRGFCAGVDYAVETVENLLQLRGEGARVYVRNKIVHNNYVVQNFVKRGVVFVDDIAEVPPESDLVLSAHGSPKGLKEEAEAMGVRVFDAVCPLVSKVHTEAIRDHRAGYSIIYICHTDHVEAKGTMSYVPMHVVESIEDVDALKIANDKISCLTQTTLSVDDVDRIIARIREKYPNLKTQKKDDICYATQNRQDSIKELSRLADLVLVVGAEISSNSKRLVETAKSTGRASYLIESCLDIKNEWLEGVSALGITLSASAPEFLLDEILDHLRKENGDFVITNARRLDEKISFKPIVLS